MSRDRLVYRCTCGSWAHRCRPCLVCAMLATERSAS